MAGLLTKADVLKKCKELSNWGKWGPDDELGVLNYITPEDIVNASKLVRKGKVFRLGLELGASGPQNGLFGNDSNDFVPDAVAHAHVPAVSPGLPLDRLFSHPCRRLKPLSSKNGHRPSDAEAAANCGWLQDTAPSSSRDNPT